MQVVMYAVLAVAVFFALGSLVCSLPDRTYKYDGHTLKCYDPSDDQKFQRLCQIEEECTDSKLCQDTVFIAVSNDNKSLLVKSIGVAIGKRYILSTVSSSFPKFFEHSIPLFAIKGKEIYVLRNASTIPRMIPGDFDAHAWNDVLLIELPNGQAFEGDDFVPIYKDNKRIKFHNKLILRRIENCQKAFNDFPVLVDNDHFSCHLDGHYVEGTSSNAEEILIGSPLYATSTTSGNDTLYLTGMRSFTADDGYFLVTKLSIHCDWIEDTTYGEVMCVN